VRDLDSRYLTFFRTFARMMRWDPVLSYLAASVTRHEEYSADLAAARMTRDPRALARALYKVVTVDGPTGAAPTTGLLGLGGSQGRAEALQRIERLLELAESPEFREAPRA
jgi:Zn-dependent protease with chaperone function